MFLFSWQLASPGRLASARDARSLTYVVKDLEAKLGPIKVKANRKNDEEVKDLIDLGEEKTEKEAKTNMAVKQVRFEEVPAEKEATTTATANSHSRGSDHGNEDEMVVSKSMQENSKGSPS